MTAGKMSTSVLSIRAVNDLTLEVETGEACHSLPGMMKFGFLLHKNDLEAHGPYYCNDSNTKKRNQPD